MASGVTVSDTVLGIYNDMKVRKTCSPEEAKQRKKIVCFRLSDDQKTIIVDEGRELLVGDIGEKVSDPYKHLLTILPKNACRYALYDASFETTETKKEVLIFIMWVPEHVPVKEKMIYASSKDGLKRKLAGLRCEVQINNPDDLLDRRTLAEKLGSSVIKLEGRPL